MGTFLNSMNVRTPMRNNFSILVFLFKKLIVFEKSADDRQNVYNLFRLVVLVKAAKKADNSVFCYSLRVCRQSSEWVGQYICD